MRKILGYAKSHIYELHAIFVATVVVVFMFLIKEPIKKWIAKKIDIKINRYPELTEKRRILVRRGNIFLILLTMFFSIVTFALAAAVSPLIEFSFPTAVMSGVFALCEYAFWEQITFDIREKGEEE